MAVVNVPLTGQQDFLFGTLKARLGRQPLAANAGSTVHSGLPRIVAVLGGQVADNAGAGLFLNSTLKPSNIDGVESITGATNSVASDLLILGF